MKKSLIKNIFKEIIKTRRRFISIMIMAFLGVGFFAGLTASSPDMLDSLDSYTDNNNMYDINIISTLGLTDADITAIKNIDEVENAYGIQTKDSLAQINDKENVCKVIEYNENINTPEIIYGKLPANSNECLLDSKYTISENIENFIGKQIILNNNETDENNNSIFTQKTFTIVGIATTPIYISNERGNSSIGNGTISYFIYTKDDVINLDYYTEIGVKIKNTKELVTNNHKYTSKVNSVISKIESIKEDRQTIRYNELINTANTKLETSKTEYITKKSEVESELQNAEAQINQAKQDLQNAESTLKTNKEELEKKKLEANTAFANADIEISNAENIIEKNEQALITSKTDFETKKANLTPQINQLEIGISKTQTALEELHRQKQALIDNGITDTADIDLQIEQTNNTVNSLTLQKQTIENTLNTYQNQIASSENQLSQAKIELENKKRDLQLQKNNSYLQISSAKTQLQNAETELTNGRNELNQKEEEFLTNKAEAETNLQETEEELNKAQDEILRIEKAIWYIQDRNDNIGYSNIFDAIKTMSNISKVFPVIFYLVAVLISLTSMARMIEEERIEIGTLKSLGYTNLQIISKYIIYSAIACIIGGIIGMSIGFYLLPTIVWKLYAMIYTLPYFHLNYQLNIGLAGTLIAFLCIGGTTILVSYKELKEMPAVLMRPKAPKNGKKIFLEKINCIWKHLNFSKKITTRNIFRYKKRAIMTIVGIAGCTGLMVTGFGIKDSIADIPEKQFGEIFKYNLTVAIDDSNKIQNITSYINNHSEIDSYSEIHASSVKIKNDNGSFDASVFIPNSNENFLKSCTIKDYQTKEPINLNQNGIIITDKVAEQLKLNVGDSVKLINGDNIEYNFKIVQIAENYVSHYVYMSKEFYEANIKTYNTNMILLNTKENISNYELEKISEKILQLDGVASVSVISSLISSIKDMLGTLNYVVIILVVASALLAFVVLYNLANINIGERQREIATLKVLGFYDSEVDNYINKENIIFTIIGIFLGLLFGFFLTSAVVISVEIDKLKFIRQIKPISYIYSSLITIVFSFIVNKVIHFVLKKIDMIESLKSVE